MYNTFIIASIRYGFTYLRRVSELFASTPWLSTSNVLGCWHVDVTTTASTSVVHYLEVTGGSLRLWMVADTIKGAHDAVPTKRAARAPQTALD